MSQFRGFTCDECGTVVAVDQRQKYTERFEGNLATGEIIKDLCARCMEQRLPGDVKLRPLRRRRSTRKPRQAVAAIS
jgi:coenzyme F420-reducing hydrogenase beta subunit